MFKAYHVIWDSVLIFGYIHCLCLYVYNLHNSLSFHYHHTVSINTFIISAGLLRNPSQTLSLLSLIIKSSVYFLMTSLRFTLLRSFQCELWEMGHSFFYAWMNCRRHCANWGFERFPYLTPLYKSFSQI